MAEKFNPAPHDKHADDPRKAALADREMHNKLEAGTGRQFSGIGSRQRGAAGAVEARWRSGKRIALGQGEVGVPLRCAALSGATR